jgi:hypothetical protein
MAYYEWGSGSPLFDGKNYQMWSKRMATFLRGKGLDPLGYHGEHRLYPTDELPHSRIEGHV